MRLIKYDEFRMELPSKQAFRLVSEHGDFRSSGLFCQGLYICHDDVCILRHAGVDLVPLNGRSSKSLL